MCLAVPGFVKEVRGDIAIVEFHDGVVREVYASAISDLKPGDMVMVHAGVIIEKVKEDELEKQVREIEELLRSLEEKAEEIEKMVWGK
ncbi:HypC/HybG/HupF family hydrogenase formation chaperone [Hyperthermus butylicus]|uniref:Hydrogenase maturation factor n=1 Tax=Hyperthermus butylicus (strain DSM 5456 / JCM 9403 / PLM1-5) TaxID=415426 RepID=A2BKU7_HYPBU|nr:HypC/HybG/HupF family hydrogenase formation chaperone [Hyperthermus butylicus]ABM80608.1 putative hydrogenase maturation factor [Hyperthermus butylicus DSM 5456]